MPQPHPQQHNTTTPTRPAAACYNIYIGCYACVHYRVLWPSACPLISCGCTTLHTLDRRRSARRSSHKRVHILRAHPPGRHTPRARRALQSSARRDQPSTTSTGSDLPLFHYHKHSILTFAEITIHKCKRSELS